MVSNFFRALISRFFIEEDWNIGIIDKPIQAVLYDSDFFESIKWIKKTNQYFLADPFHLPNSDWIYCEMYNFHSRIGTIVKIDPESADQEPKESNITSKAHLSYPFMFSDFDGVYCIPESSAEDKVSIYKLENEVFKIKKTLIKENLVDSTILQNNHKYWLFCTKSTENYGKEKLHIYSCVNPFEEWEAHIKNPVKSDISSSRPAGGFFEYKGELYRPAQNCEVDYGKSIAINKIIELTENEFKEEHVVNLKADKFHYYNDGIHTINAFGSKTIIDGKRKVFSPLKPLKTLFSNSK